MRLITRSDFDGLICGMLLKEAGIIDSWQFVHPKDLQDGLFQPTEDDVLANVPYVPGCGMWFDHHTSENDRVGWSKDVQGESRLAPSAARIIYEYYGGAEKFPAYGDMIEAVDKVDSGQLTREEILNPKVIPVFTDPRRLVFREFINYQRKTGQPLPEQHRRDPTAGRGARGAHFSTTRPRRWSIHTKVVNVIVTDLRTSPIYTQPFHLQSTGAERLCLDRRRQAKQNVPSPADTAF